jgi:hypothetical protein
MIGTEFVRSSRRIVCARTISRCRHEGMYTFLLPKETAPRCPHISKTSWLLDRKSWSGYSHLLSRLYSEKAVHWYSRHISSNRLTARHLPALRAFLKPEVSARFFTSRYSPIDFLCRSLELHVLDMMKSGFSPHSHGPGDLQF